MAKPQSPETLALIAERFHALGEPTRLQLLMSLQQGERSVSDLVRCHNTSQANISKHLRILTTAGIIARRKQGLHVYYRIADPTIFDLCEIVCGGVKKHLDERAGLLASE